MRLLQMGCPAYPISSESLVGHQSWVWVGSDTTCNVAVTLSPKWQSDGVCSATVYRPKILLSLIQCGILICDIGFSLIKIGFMCCLTKDQLGSSLAHMLDEPSLSFEKIQVRLILVELVYLFCKELHYSSSCIYIFNII